MFFRLQQARLKRECKSYIAFMTKLAEEKTVSLARQKEAEVESKRQLLVLAHARHKAQLEMLREDRKSRREEDDRRKRAVFEDLQEQVRPNKFLINFAADTPRYNFLNDHFLFK